jgi:creatinine amidohydrolase
MVLPLGNGYRLELLAEALGNPQAVYLLPAFPFGWEGSGLTVSGTAIEQYLTNLIGSLLDDGFSNSMVLLPQGINLHLKVRWIALHKKDAGNVIQALPINEERGKVVVIPIGHTEQHGHHLALSTDTTIIEAVAQGTCSIQPELTCVLPAMPYGVSTHRQAFAGTLNAGGRAFEDFWSDVIDVLTLRGFDRFYFMSGHGGNSSFINNVVKYAGERHRRIFCATAWLYLSGADGVAALEKHRQSKTGGMGHAGELETSLMLYLKPELVHMDRVIDEIDFITTSNYYMDWVEGGALIANPPWDDDSKTGAYGAGSLATAEKGRLWLQAAIDEKVTHIKEIHLQHQLREDRRNSGYGLWGKK